ncbi:hypothetical protein [Desertivirga xinjiangensis]|uniref:hypothetical protein n=1 Tax=Desertivirga xinjiangensis TaxID=539206 RepID=UPI00210D947E|nr:hypothetical protein [Pedobacter xinjiangensis]
MKTLRISILAWLQFISFLSLGQNVTREQLVREVESFKAAALKATEVFLNPKGNLQTRLLAMQNYPFIYDPQQIAKAKAILLNDKEDPQLRAVALSKLVAEVSRDEALSNSVLKWIQDPKTPKALRNETLNTIIGLRFSDFAMFTKRQQLIAALRTVVTDPELSFRQFAFGFLMDHGDSFAQNLLIEQLNANKTNLLPTVEILRLLALYPKGDYLPAVYRIFQNPPNQESKIEAIILCGNYAPAKKTLMDLLKDKKQSADLRQVVLSTVNANYPQEFAAQVQSMIVDQTEPENLRVSAIVMETFRRQSNIERSKRKAPDAFDRNVERLKSNPSEAIRRASGSYLRNVKPKL